MADKNTTKASNKINRADIRSTVDGTFLLYKNRPLVREENILCYGSLDEGYVVEMVIMSMKEYKGNEVPDKVFVQLLKTDQTLPKEKRVVRQAMEDGLSGALELGTIWLDRYLAS